MEDIAVLLQKKEIDFDGIRTKNMYSCKEARRLFQKMINDINNNKFITHPDNTDNIEKTKDFIKNKPESTKKQQFKHFLDL